MTRRSGNGRGCNALRTQKTYARSDWTNAGEVIGAWSCRADLPLVPCVASKLCRHRLRAQPPLRCSPCACCPSRCDQTTAAESAASEILDYGGRTKFSGDQTAQWAVVEARTGRCPRRVERSATKSWLVQKKPTAPSWCESALWRLRVAQLEVSARMSGSRFVAAARRGDYRSRINHLHMATGPASLSINSSSVQSTKPTRGEGTANAVLGGTVDAAEPTVAQGAPQTGGRYAANFRQTWQTTIMSAFHSASRNLNSRGPKSQNSDEEILKNEKKKNSKNNYLFGIIPASICPSTGGLHRIWASVYDARA